MEAKLSRLQEDNRAVDERSKAYLESQKYQQESEKLDLQKKIDALDASISQDQAELTALVKNRYNPGWNLQQAHLQSEVASLKSQKNELAQQKGAVDVQGRKVAADVSNEVVTERSDIVSERERIQRQLNETKADLVEWKKRPQTKAPPDGDQIRDLRNQISLQAEKVANLEKMIKVMSENSVDQDK